MTMTKLNPKTAGSESHPMGYIDQDCPQPELRHPNQADQATNAFVAPGPHLPLLFLTTTHRQTLVQHQDLPLLPWPVRSH